MVFCVDKKTRIIGVTVYVFLQIYLLRDLSVALSACIYQCLCDSDSFVVAEMPDDVGLMGFTSIDVVYKDSFLMAGARRKESADSVPIQLPTSQPSMWPGMISIFVAYIVTLTHT